MSSSGTSRVSSAIAEFSLSTDVESVVSPYDAWHRLYNHPGAMLTIHSSVSLAHLPSCLLVGIAYMALGIKPLVWQHISQMSLPQHCSWA